MKIISRIFFSLFLIFFNPFLHAKVISDAYLQVTLPNGELHNLMSGDIIVSKSNYLMSSLVTQITEPISEYSHSNVLIISANNMPFIIDVSPKDGVSLKTFNLEKFNKNKIRYRVLRIKDKSKAHKFASNIMSIMHQCRDCNHPTYFDFNFDRFKLIPASNRYTCTEIVAEALRASKITDLSIDQSNYARLTRFKEAHKSQSELINQLPNLVLTPNAFLKNNLFETVAVWKNPYEEKISFARDAALLLEVFNPNLAELDKDLLFETSKSAAENFFFEEDFLRSIKFNELDWQEKLISIQFLVRVKKRYEELKNLTPGELDSMTKLIKDSSNLNSNYGKQK